ncbi:hypothetical protein BGZ93_005717 [Podila epicladia]|nr:hypothetical protein BGZ92_010963 [Podila epicladia]KAG0095568.1 hypothetical protein BGZ93_005717 [Podila epicladia]
MADPWDDWEQANETEIRAPVVAPKRTPMILQRKKTPDPKPAHDNVSLHEQNRAIWDKANAYEQPVIARTDNSMRTEYVPEIRILRRPKSPVTAVRVAATPSKPLEQRQADYNAAREKIFGPQDRSNNSSSSSTSTSPSSSRPGSRRGSPTPRSSATQMTQGQGQGPAPVKPIEFRGAPPPRIRPAQRSVSGGGNAQDHVVRQPRGPTMAAPASHNNSNSPRSLMARPQQESRNDARGGQGGTKARGDASEPSSSSSSGGSIGFRKPFKGGPPSSSQSSTTLS